MRHNCDIQGSNPSWTSKTFMSANGTKEVDSFAGIKQSLNLNELKWSTQAPLTYN